MSIELLSLRILTVSGAATMRGWLRQGADSVAVPVETIEAPRADVARDALLRGADVVYLDDSLASEERAAVVRAARAARRPPFLIQFAAADAPAQPFEADALAVKPARLEEAKQLVDRSIRVRMPSRVLVVDDSQTMRSIVRKILAATRLPLEVSEAGEGLAALRQVRLGNFHLIFLDCNMPEFNGFETLAELKREQRPASVIMMTSTQDDTFAERAQAQGAIAFLKKPFYPADIDAVMCRFYGLRAFNPQRP